MSSSDDSPQRAAPTTTILLVSGDQHRVEGDPREVERAILDAARGSIMQFAWFAEVDTGDELAVNPEHVILLRG